MKPVLILTALLLAGCAKNIDTTDAVKQGIVKYVAKKADIQNMNVSVQSVSFRGKEATANVSFSARADPKQSITMSYTMERQGDEWNVKGSDMQRHGQTPPGTPLPPGHPATQPGSSKLPPGHPVSQ